MMRWAIYLRDGRTLYLLRELAHAAGRAFLVTLFACSIASNSASAAEPSSTTRYRLIEGRGNSACEDFLRNLNAFPPQEPPLVCQLKIHPSRREFSLPGWQEMDIRGNLPLIYEAERLLVRFTPTGSTPPPFSAWRAKYETRLASGDVQPRLRRLRVDLNGSGAETLISYEPVRDECQAELKKYQLTDGPGGHVFVLRQDSKQLQSFGGLHGTEERTEVLLYQKKVPYFVTAGPDGVVSRGSTREVWSVGIHPVDPKLTPDGRYRVRHLCTFHTDR